MNNYKKSLWTSNFIILLFAVLITFAVKFTINPFLLQQQVSLTEKLNLHDMPIVTNLTQLNDMIEHEQFAYIKISNAALLSPLLYENKKFPPLSYLLPISSTTVSSQEGKQSIEFKANNIQLLASTQQILLIIYAALIIISLFINCIYLRLFKNIEKILIQEISGETSSASPFSRVSEQLHKQKESFQHTLQKQEEQISQLAQQINMDKLTGLNNRHAFHKELSKILSEESREKHAILFILRASELNTINSQQGFQRGNHYIINIANILKKTTELLPAVSVYRINGTDFALIAQEMNIGDAQNLAKKLKTEFDQYQSLNDLHSVAYNGISAMTSGELPEQILTRTDMALAKAQIEGINGWAFEQKNSDNNQLGQQHWQQIIEEIISKRALMLFHQPIQAIHHNMKGYQKIFTRFHDDSDNMIPADTVFAMAQRIDMIVELEQLILETVVIQYHHKADSNTRWGVNITSSAIQNKHFIIWLERLLLREPNMTASLVFELQEEVLENDIIASKRIFDMFKRTGARSAICKFGKGVGSFRLFKALHPDFVKIDASLINNIERDSANQQFVRMIIDVAHRMDCQVIAEGVEHLGQKQILENMYVDGIQGFLVTRPNPL